MVNGGVPAVQTTKGACDGRQVRDQQGKAGKFRFHLKAADGEIIAASQAHASAL
jgi:hypothetical protein